MKYIFLALCLAASAVLQAQPGKLDRSIRPVAGPAPVINLGKAKMFTLENGLKVFVVEDHKLPRVTMNLVLDNDPVMEGAKAGYLDVFSSLMLGGTLNMPKDSLDKEIDKMGADIFASSSNVYGRCLKKHLPKFAAIFSDVVLKPAFPQEEFDKEVKKMNSSLAAAKENPNAISGNVTSKVVYGNNHPYGEVTTVESLETVTIEDCKKYYETYFAPNVSYLAIVGDITYEEAQKLVQTSLGGWAKKEVPKHTYAEVTPPAKTTFALVDRPSAVQSVINIVNPVKLHPADADVIPARVMNNILGGGASGRLFQNLREKHGYTYGAYSSINADEIVGTFSASASVRNAVTDSAVMEFMNEINRIRTEGVSQQELARTIAFISGSFARSLENSQTIAGFYLNAARYNLPEDYYATYLKKLAAVTVEDVRRVADKYVAANNEHIIIVGNIAEFKEKLAKMGDVVEYDIDGNKIVREPNAPAAPVITVTAEDVMKKYTDAIGGAANLAKVKDYKIVSTSSIQGIDLTANTYVKGPNLVKKEVLSLMGAQIRLFDGVKGYENNRDGKRDITGKELDDLKLRSNMFAETKFKALNVPMTVVGIEKVGGKDAYIVEATLPSGDKTRLFFDVESGLKVKETLSVPGGPMGPVTVHTLYSDYREVNGVKFPYNEKRIIGPQTLEFKVKEVVVNPKLKKSIFKL